MEKLPFKPLETKRLRLRCVEPKDVAAMSALITPEVSRWVAYWPVPYTSEMSEKRIEKARERAFRKDGMPFALTLKGSDEMIGWVSVSRNDEDKRRASFGYWLGVEHHGKGYMKELAPVVVQEAFEWLDVDVIDAAAQPENVASFKVMATCGMQHVGEVTIYVPTREREELCLLYEVRRQIT